MPLYSTKKRQNGYSFDEQNRSGLPTYVTKLFLMNQMTRKGQLSASNAKYDNPVTDYLTRYTYL